MTKNITTPDEVIISKIYLLRGQKVMLDRDLAEMYRVETRRLNEQVKRNLNRFSESFMFQVTEEEIEMMVSQNAIPSRQVLGGSLPKAEHGVLMLPTLSKAEKRLPKHKNNRHFCKTSGNAYRQPRNIIEVGTAR